MEAAPTIGSEFEVNGFAVLNNIFSAIEVEEIGHVIAASYTDDPVFRKAKDVFAIRRFLLEVPQVKSFIFTHRFCQLIENLFGTDYFVSKSIYFDKPPASNWFVASHQDLTISVKKKADVPGFGPWTIKPNQFAVQPPVALLENNFTVRIHLDDTNEENGALRVVPGSHKKGIIRTEIGQQTETVSCNVLQGGIMLMRPLLLHASGRTTNQKRRRVIHIEFSESQLPAPLQWAEYLSVKN